MIEHNKTHMAHASGLSAADEIALYAHMGRLMDQAAEHRYACDLLQRAYGSILPTPYQGVHATHYAAREALDAQIRALGSALYPDEGAESADELDDTPCGGAVPLAGEAGRISGGAATPDEMKRVATRADPARIIGYIESDTDDVASWHDEWRAFVVVVAATVLLALAWRVWAIWQ